MFDPNRNAFKKLWLTLTVFGLLMLAACSDNSFEVVAQFDNTRDIKVGTSVVWQGVSVGEVSSVTLADNGSLVQLSLNPATAAEISHQAAVVVNRIKPGAPLEIHNPAGPISQTLQAGQTIHAMDSMLELMAWSVGDALNSGGKQLTAMVEGFQDYIQGEEFQRGKQQVQQQMTDAMQTTGSALKTLEQDLVASMDNMIATEEQLATAIDDLGDELAPMVQEMSRSSAQLASQIDQFVRRMETATPEEQASGERLIRSLADMIEKMNSSLESGAIQQNKPIPDDNF